MSVVSSQPAVHRGLLRRWALEGLLLFLLVAMGGGLLLLVGPSLLSWSQHRAHEADRNLLQQAVGDYRRTAPATRPWPTLSSRIGDPREGAVTGYECDGSDPAEVCSWMDIQALVASGSLPGSDVVSSADSARNATATNAPSGHYGWYLDAGGRVQSSPRFSRERGYP